MSVLIGNLTMTNALDSIGENILLADLNYDVIWMNEEAKTLFTSIAPLFGHEKAEDLIGMNMDQFHRRPSYQRDIMKGLSGKHKARINIKNQFVADIVITPLRNDEGKSVAYIVMLMDVTTKAEEEQRKDHLLELLSIPILKVWEKTIAVPLIGDFDESRADRLQTLLLNECTDNDVHYVLIDLSGIHTFNNQMCQHIQQLDQCLQLVGTECLVVGVTPKLAMSFENFSQEMRTFKNTHTGLQYILKHES